MTLFNCQKFFFFARISLFFEARIRAISKKNVKNTNIEKLSPLQWRGDFLFFAAMQAPRVGALPDNGSPPQRPLTKSRPVHSIVTRVDFKNPAK